MQIINGAKLPTVTSTAIYGFFGDYRFLSNFHVCSVDLGEGIIYPSSEAAFMAQKTEDDFEKRQISTMTPSEAKAYGRTLILRSDWEHHRVVAMMRAVTAKFTQHPDLAIKLIDTAGLYLEETNDWGDQFWGVDGTGLNMLGHTLMFVRDFVLPNHPHI